MILIYVGSLFISFLIFIYFEYVAGSQIRILDLLAMLFVSALPVLNLIVGILRIIDAHKSGNIGVFGKVVLHKKKQGKE